MATSEVAAARGPSASSSCGSKRGACDRCRGQKLRCLPEDQSQTSTSATCARCHRAGAACSFGIAKRPGRPSTSKANSSHSRRNNGGGAPAIDKTISSTNINSSNQKSFDEGRDSQADEAQDWRSTAHQGSGQIREQPGEHFQESLCEDTNNMLATSPNLPWSLTPVFSNDAGESLGSDPFGSRYGWPFQEYLGQIMGIQSSSSSPLYKGDLPIDGVFHSYPSSAQTYSVNPLTLGPPDGNMDLDIPGLPMQAAHNRPGKATKLPSKGRGISATDRAHGLATLETSSTGTSTSFQENTEQRMAHDSEEENLTSHDVQHRRMQELSELAMNLYTQLLASESEKQQPVSDATSATFRDQLIGSVLKSSDSFLALLTSFPSSTNGSPPSCPPPPPTPSVGSNQSRCSSHDSDSFSSLTSLPDRQNSTTSKMESQHPFDSSTTLHSELKPSAPADFTTVLQLLTCYMHIIHLHSTMHAHILDYVLNYIPDQTNQPNSPIPPVFPGMQIGGVSLDRFGTFQVKLLLQVSLRVLGDIEMALGLPEEFRVAKKKSGAKGVLETSVSADFVNSLMREEAWRGKRVELVRERLGNLRKVLKSG